MSRSARSAVGLVFVLAFELLGCKGPSNFSFVLEDLPAEGHWLSVIGVDGDGRFVRASRLVEVGDTETLAILIDASGTESFDLNVFEESRLRAVGFDPMNLAMQEEAPVETEGLERRLPPPSLVARFDEGGLRQEGERDWPLAVSWARCANLVGDGAVVSLSCESIRCHAAVSQDGCRLALEAPGCVLDLRGQVVADEPRFESSASLGQCLSIQPTTGGLWSAECTGGEREAECRIDVFPEDAPSSLEHHRLVFPHEPILERLFDEYFEAAIPESRAAPEPVVGRPVVGYMNGMFVSGDHLVVVRNTSASNDGDALVYGCPPHRTGTFERVSLETGEWLSTTTVTPCISQIVPEPAASLAPDAVIALLATEPRALLRLRPDGSPLGEPVPIPALDARYVWLQLVGPTADRKLYVFGGLPPPAENDPPPTIPKSLVFEIDASNLRTLRRVGEAHEQIELITLLDGDRPVYLRAGDLEIIHDLRTGEEIADLRSKCLHQIIPTALARTSPGGPLVVTADSDDAPSLLTLSGAALERCQGAPFPWFFSAGVSVSRWPDEPELLIASFLEVQVPPSVRRSAVVLFDPATARYDGGPLLIGTGPATYPTVDPSGAVWFLSPWANELVRVRARSGATISR